MKVFFIAVFFALCGHCHAQLADSLRELFKHKYSIDARLESRNSFIDHNLISVTGVRLGLAFQRKLKIGFGLSWLKTNGGGFLETSVKRNFYSTNDLGKTDTINKYLKIVYACLYADFVFYKIKHWQLSVPIQVGAGSLWFQEERSYSFRKKDPKYFLFLYEPGITVQYKIFRWVGLGTDVAYRFALQNSKKTGVRLSSPSLTFKVLFWFDQLFYEIAPNSKLSKRFGPAYW